MLLAPGAVGLWLVTGGRGLTAHAARLVALAAAAVGGVGAVVAAITRPVVDREWIPELGVRWHLGVDGISAPLLVLTAVIGVVVVAHAWVEQPWDGHGAGVRGSAATYLGALLLVETGALAAFAARDALLFFIAFKLLLSAVKHIFGVGFELSPHVSLAVVLIILAIGIVASFFSAPADKTETKESRESKRSNISIYFR